VESGETLGVETMPEVKYYRNTMTGLKSQPHRLGTTEDGRGIYLALEGWEPLDENEEPIEVEIDSKGTWII
jgi:hypothetical protein